MSAWTIVRLMTRDHAESRACSWCSSRLARAAHSSGSWSATSIPSGEGCRYAPGRSDRCHFAIEIPPLLLSLPPRALPPLAATGHIRSLQGDLKYEGTITPAVEMKWRDGRIGICVLALGFNLMQSASLLACMQPPEVGGGSPQSLTRVYADGSMLLCPRRDKPGSVWLPGYWQRRHIMYTSALLFVVLLMALEFSFSRLFSQNALAFMMVFKVVWVREHSRVHGLA